MGLRPHRSPVLSMLKGNNPLPGRPYPYIPRIANKFLQKGILAGWGRGIPGAKLYLRRHPRGILGERKESGVPISG